MIAKKCKGMSRHQLKEYHRPYMVVETFVPNEFVAACVHPQLNLYANGVFCFDINGDNKYNDQEASNLGGDYLEGNYINDFHNGFFKIDNQGRYYHNGGAAYLYLGSSFQWWYGTYEYAGDNCYHYDSADFTPLYFADLTFNELNDEGQVHKARVYYTGPGGLGAISNLS